MKLVTTNYNYNRPSFHSWKREVYKKSKDNIYKELKHRNDTWFCRDGFRNGAIYDYVIKKFKNIDKVNTYFWGCSNGCEVYTFLNELFAKFGPKTAEKFGPIIALDYDPIAIFNAKLGCYPIENQEIIDLEKHHGQKITENFHIIYNPLNIKEVTHVIPKQKLKKCVKFDISDITKDCSRMKAKNNLIFARNMWPYLEPSKIYQYAKNLYNHIGNNSSLIIGDYDIAGWRWHGINTNELFKNAGFKQTTIPTIFEK